MNLQITCDQNKIFDNLIKLRKFDNFFSNIEYKDNCITFNTTFTNIIELGEFLLDNNVYFTTLGLNNV